MKKTVIILVLCALAIMAVDAQETPNYTIDRYGDFLYIENESESDNLKKYVLEDADKSLSFEAVSYRSIFINLTSIVSFDFGKSKNYSKEVVVIKLNNDEWYELDWDDELINTLQKALSDT